MDAELSVGGVRVSDHEAGFSLKSHLSLTPERKYKERGAARDQLGVLTFWGSPSQPAHFGLFPDLADHEPIGDKARSQEPESPATAGLALIPGWTCLG